MAASVSLAEFNAVKSQYEATIAQLRDGNNTYVTQITDLNNKYGVAVADGTKSKTELKLISAQLVKAVEELQLRELAINKLQSEVMKSESETKIVNLTTDQARIEAVRINERMTALQADNSRLLNELAQLRNNPQPDLSRMLNQYQQPVYQQLNEYQMPHYLQQNQQQPYPSALRPPEQMVPSTSSPYYF